jgi:hypothetical protein
LRVRIHVEMDVDIWNTLTIPTILIIIGEIAYKNKGGELLDSSKPVSEEFQQSVVVRWCRSSFPFHRERMRL